jgi:hypothetical protein
MIRSIRLSLALLAVSLSLPLAADDALSLVPANAVTVGMVKVADLRTSPLAAPLFEHTDKISTDGEAEQFLTEAGLAPTKDVDVLVVATYPRTALGSEGDVLVIAEGRFDPARLTAALVARGAVKKNGYLLPPDEDDDDKHGAVAFPSSSMVIAGTEKAVIDALAALKSGGTGFVTRGSLGLDLSRIDPNATAWAIVDVARAGRLVNGGKIETGSGAPGEALQSALRSLSTVAFWAKDKGNALELNAIGLSTDNETLQLLEDTIRGAFAAMRLAVKDKAPEMVSVIRGFDVKRSDGSIRVNGSIPAESIRNLMAKKHAANH